MPFGGPKLLMLKQLSSAWYWVLGDSNNDNSGGSGEETPDADDDRGRPTHDDQEAEEKTDLVAGTDT
jgi:hypothetical protein